jgi:Uma2 family endonuclease
MEHRVPSHTRPITEQEYLRLEESAKTKHEFRHGEIIDMAGGTSDHSLVAANIIIEIGNRLKGSPCKVFGSDLRVRCDEFGHYDYPDATIVCGPLEYHQPEKRTIVTNPRVIIEVTSESSEAYDRGDKFTDYRAIDSVQEYFLVAQDRMQVESFYRQESGIWAFGPRYTRPDESVCFLSLEIKVTLAEIYAGVVLPPEPPKPAEPVET